MNEVTNLVYWGENLCGGHFLSKINMVFLEIITNNNNALMKGR